MTSLTRWTWVWVNSGIGDGQGGLACGDSWGSKESDTTERLIWSDLIKEYVNIPSLSMFPFIYSWSSLFLSIHSFALRPSPSLFFIYCSISPVDGSRSQLSITFCLQTDNPENERRVKRMGWGEGIYQTQINKNKFILSMHPKYLLSFLKFKQQIRFYILI